MSDDKIEQAIFKIFRMTHEGILNWTTKPAPCLWTHGTDSVFPLYFETLYQGRKVALFLERRRTSTLEKMFPRNIGDDQGDWSQFIRLALLGDNDEIMFEFPWSRQIKGLFDAVRYKESNVEEFLDELLKVESIGEK
ncbi:MAG: hypothetical protein V4641_26720 [Pseudomonadota bacterium]